MGIVEEWEKSLPSENTKQHHRRGLKYFVQFMGEDPETLLKLRKEEYGESKRFETQVLEFFKWLQKDKKLSQNSARSYVIGVQSFFSYYNVPLQLKRKLPNLHMKLDERKLRPKDLRALFKYNDLAIKLWMSLSKDCPARPSDLLEFRRKQIKTEFLIQSKKENVIGKVFLSDETIDLFQRFWETVPKSEYAFSTSTGDRYTPNGIRKLLRRAAQKAGLKDLELHQHQFRKLFFTIGVNSGIPEMVLKILMFKSISPDLLTYYLDREDLRDYWRKIKDQLSLEPRANGKITNIEQMVDLMLQAWKKMIIKELKGRPISGITPIVFEEMSAEELLKLFLEKNLEKRGR